MHVNNFGDESNTEQSDRKDAVCRRPADNLGHELPHGSPRSANVCGGHADFLWKTESEFQNHPDRRQDRKHTEERRKGTAGDNVVRTW